jgi:hypothetical protein
MIADPLARGVMLYERILLFSCIDDFLFLRHIAILLAWLLRTTRTGTRRCPYGLSACIIVYAQASNNRFAALYMKSEMKVGDHKGSLLYM